MTTLTGQTRKARVTIPGSDAGKFEEIDALEQYADHIRDGGQTYLSGLFTPAFVEWCSDKIRADVMPDIHQHMADAGKELEATIDRNHKLAELYLREEERRKALEAELEMVRAAAIRDAADAARERQALRDKYEAQQMALGEAWQRDYSRLLEKANELQRRIGVITEERDEAREAVETEAAINRTAREELQAQIAKMRSALQAIAEELTI